MKKKVTSVVFRKWFTGTMIVVVVVLVVVFVFVAKDVMASDWKYVGGSELKKEVSACFYDRESIEFLPNGNFTAWVKSVKVQEIKKISKKEKIIDKSARKLLKRYYPPYVRLKGASSDNYIDCIILEESANDPETQTHFVGLLEIDCIKKKSRFLSATVYTKDGPSPGSYDNPKWDYITPDTTGDTLMKIVCPFKP
jgi:hypothetical protein